jgi:hypothetical protein
MLVVVLELNEQLRRGIHTYVNAFFEAVPHFLNLWSIINCYDSGKQEYAELTRGISDHVVPSASYGKEKSLKPTSSGAQVDGAKYHS